MSEEDKQAVTTETNAPAQPGAEATPDARNDADDLDTLLSQYDDGKPSADPKPEPKAGADNDLGALAEQVKGMLSEHQQVTFRRDMEATLKSVRGDMPAEYFDDTFVEAWIDSQARTDPRLAAAWQQRHSNPKQFQKVVDGLGRTFAKKYSKLPDKGATEDREAVTAAVRGASTRAPEGKAPDYATKSDAEFREDVRKQFGFTPL